MPENCILRRLPPAEHLHHQYPWKHCPLWNATLRIFFTNFQIPQKLSALVVLTFGKRALTHRAESQKNTSISANLRYTYHSKTSYTRYQFGDMKNKIIILFLFSISIRKFHQDNAKDFTTVFRSDIFKKKSSLFSTFYFIRSVLKSSMTSSQHSK